LSAPSFRTSISSFGAALLPLALLSVPASADSEQASSGAYLTSTVVSGGQTLLTLHGQTPQSGSVSVVGYIMLGSAPTPIDPGVPWPILHVGGFSAVTGPMSAAGTYSSPAPISGTMYAQGLFVDTNGILRGTSFALELSSVAAPSTWTDVSGALPPPGFATNDVDVGDFDRDGTYDLVTAAAGTGAHTLLLMNQAGGGYTESSSLLPTAALATAFCVEVGDVGADGWDDIFLGVESSTSLDPNVLVRNQGGGTFVHDALFPGGTGDAMDAEFGDANGDGFLDLVVLNRIDLSAPPPYPYPLSDPAMLYVWDDAQQKFQIKYSFLAIPGNTRLDQGADGDISLADLDVDGDLDVFVTRSDDDQDRLWINAGSASFTDASAFVPVGTLSTFEAGILDANQDGWPDVVVAGLGSRLWMNQGGSPPTFVDGSSALPFFSNGFPTSLDVGDVDADGDEDIVFSTHVFSTGQSSLVLNQGGVQAGTLGQFVNQGFGPSVTGIQGDAAFVDYDGDGDLDCYVGVLGTSGSAIADLLIRND